jgi:asparagine synthase (glutamine-hydrolysing)
MFAFAVFDTQESRLWLARDRAGIKPLFLLRNGEGLAFASELRGLLPCPLLSGRVNALAAHFYLKRLYVPAPLAILEGVEKVLPGHAICFDLREGAVQREETIEYASVADVAMTANPIGDSRTVLERLEFILQQAVGMRLVADVPIGALLSGGIDSSLVVALMQEMSPNPIHTFTIGFDEPEFDEREKAAEVARYLGTDHECVNFNESDVLDMVPTLPDLCDEPMANPSLLPTSLISKVARRRVKVALSGDGGDELFGGYRRYREGARLLRLGAALPRPIRRLLCKAIGGSLGEGVAQFVGSVLPTGTMGGQHSIRERRRKVAGVLAGCDARSAYNALLDVGLSFEASEWGEGVVLPGDGIAPRSLADVESWMMLLDQLEYLPGDLLDKVDRASMGQGLEVRVPLLDQEVVEFSWQIPTALKLRDGVKKWPLRELAAKRLPREVLDRPKMGFTVPVRKWLKGSLREWAWEMIQQWDKEGCEIGMEVSMASLWHRFQKGEEEHGLGIWAVAVLMAWSDYWKATY